MRMKTRNNPHSSPKREREDSTMDFIENKDYRMSGRFAYFSNRFKQRYFTLGSEEQVAIDRFRNEHHCLIRFASDHFILTGKSDSPF